MVHDRVLAGVNAGVVVVEVVGVVTVVVVEVAGVVTVVVLDGVGIVTVVVLDGVDIVTVGVVAAEPPELDAPDEGDAVETGEVLVGSDVLPPVPAWDVAAGFGADDPPTNGLRALPACGTGA
jgi:hypothetical protein